MLTPLRLLKGRHAFRKALPHSLKDAQYMLVSVPFCAFTLSRIIRLHFLVLVLLGPEAFFHYYLLTIDPQATTVQPAKTHTRLSLHHHFSQSRGDLSRHLSMARSIQWALTKANACMRARTDTRHCHQTYWRRYWFILFDTSRVLSPTSSSVSQLRGRHKFYRCCDSIQHGQVRLGPGYNGQFPCRRLRVVSNLSLPDHFSDVSIGNGVIGLCSRFSQEGTSRSSMVTLCDQSACGFEKSIDFEIRLVFCQVNSPGVRPSLAIKIVIVGTIAYQDTKSEAIAKKRSNH